MVAHRSNRGIFYSLVYALINVKYISVLSMYICTYLSLGICSQVIHSQFLYQLYGLPALCDDKHMPTTITKVTNDSVTLVIVVGMLIQCYSRLQPSIFLHGGLFFGLP